MRLIGKLANEKQAFVFYSYLLKEGIHSTYEKEVDREKKTQVVSIWIYEEDQIEKAEELLAEFQANPKAPKFASIEFPEAPPQPPDLIAEQKEEEARKEAEKLGRTSRMRFGSPGRQKKKRSYPLTLGIIFLCVFLYFIQGAQQMKMVKADGKLALQIGLTPIQQKLLFDYPKSNQAVDQLLEKYPLRTTEKLSDLPPEELAAFKEAEAIPTWKGVLNKMLVAFGKAPPTQGDPPLFGKIKEGEVWRLFTPCLLHGGLLHILFNMAWAWLLLRMLEERLSKVKLILLVILIGIVANLAQYLISGPFFLGFSGVVCGLVGFIFVRQKVAPWEGYPLTRSTFIFILVFVGAMFALEIFSLFISLFSTKALSAQIANTAHIVGGLTGALLGRLNFFSRNGR